MVATLQASHPTVTSATAGAANLCLSCGLCCDGTLFKDVEVRADDLAAKNAMRLLPTKRDGAQESPLKAKWPQPCAALCRDLQCQIYADRPTRCRDFECLLSKSVLAGSREPNEAVKIVRRTRRMADLVRHLLRELGDEDERLSLGRRFRRTRRRCESGGLNKMDEAATERYAELTLAVHQLQVLLQREFYPGH